MTSHETALEEIRGRLVRLERQNRRLKQIGTAALIVAASLVLMGQASPKKTIEANEFILRDGGGNVRARLAVNPSRAHGAPEMFFFDEKGNPRLQLDGGPGIITDGGGAISVYDGKGKVGGSLSALASSGGMLILDNWNGKIGASLITGRLDLLDDEGFEASMGTADLVTPRTGATQRTSAASLVLFDKDKNVIWRAP